MCCKIPCTKIFHTNFFAPNVFQPTRRQRHADHQFNAHNAHATAAPIRPLTCSGLRPVATSPFHHPSTPLSRAHLPPQAARSAGERDRVPGAGRGACLSADRTEVVGGHHAVGRQDTQRVSGVATEASRGGLRFCATQLKLRAFDWCQRM